MEVNSAMRFTEHERTKLKQEIALFITSFGSSVTNLRKCDEANNGSITNVTTKAHHTEVINNLLEVNIN